LFDVAGDHGVPPHTEDLGQTFGVWGIDEGPYIVLPLIGPSTPRDTVGNFADAYLDPLFYADFSGRNALLVGRHLGGLVDGTARAVKEIRNLDKSFADPYAATRSLYRQHRNAEIRDGATDPNLPEITPELILDNGRQ
jgi:phospholipid-binding lipoprotein MlaA